MEQYEKEYLKKHFENLIQRYRDAGVSVELDKPIDEVIEEGPSTIMDGEFYIHVKIKINDRFYLTAQGDNLRKHLYAFEIKEAVNNETCKEPEQIAAFMKLFKGDRR